MFKKIFIALFAFLAIFNTAKALEETQNNQEATINNIKNESLKEKSTIKKFSILEIEGKAKKNLAIVVSGNKHNANSKTILVAPVVVKKNSKPVKGKNIIIFKSSGKEYIIFADKIRTVKQENLTKSPVMLNEKEKINLQKTINNIFN